MGAFIFVPALAACAVLGFVFLLFSAHYYLAALQSSGAGARHIVWQTEPVLDGFWKMFYLGGLLIIWLGPAFVIGRIIAAGNDAAWLRLAVPCAVMWLCYPISQLSSLSGPTIWLPLHPDAIARLFQKPAVVISFYLLSSISVVILGVGFYWTFFAKGLHWLVIGCPVLVISAMFYARLLGRLAFVLSYTKPIFSRRKNKRERAEAETVSFPIPVPEADTPIPVAGAEKSRKRIVAEAIIDVVTAPQPVPHRGPSHDPSRRWTEDDEDRTPYFVTEAAETPAEAKPENVIKPSAEEVRLLSRDDVPKKPKRAWTGELFAMFAQPETWSVILLLSGICFLFGGVVRVARAVNPVAGEP